MLTLFLDGVFAPTRTCSLSIEREWRVRTGTDDWATRDAIALRDANTVEPGAGMTEAWVSAPFENSLAVF